MTSAQPDWLTRRQGELRAGVSGTWLVVLSTSQQYKLDVRPAQGKFTCVILQSNNGRRLDKAAEYADAGAALQGGLDELRQALGW